MQNTPFCQSSKNDLVKKPVVAAFDFDGTITTRDSLLLFLVDTTGYFKTFFKLTLHLPLFCGYLLKLKSRKQVKESLIKSFFKGMPIETLQMLGEKFAKGSINSIVKKVAVDEIKRHQALGHRCIIVSANLDVYLDAFAKLNGFTDCIASKVAFDEEGRVTGSLDGVNCRGAEKVRRMEKVLGERDQYILYVYGDSDGDKEMLEYADHAFYRSF